MDEKNKNHKKYKKNKNSIIRVIISNFDDRSIKEFKVLYVKNGGVDTFVTKTRFDEDSNNILFDYCEYKPIYKERSSEILPKEKHKKDNLEISIFEKDKENLIRKYKISGKYRKTHNNEILVTLYVEDLSDRFKDLMDSKKRVNISSTERVLLSSDVMENYNYIAQAGKDNIDSKKIYKINRFLSYRSKMLLFFNFINSFLVKDLKDDKLKEIWKLIENNIIIDSANIEKIVENFTSNIHVQIENYNNYIQKYNTSDFVVNCNKEKLPCLDIIEKDKISEDVKKIIFLVSDFRHKIMHYNFEYFDKLFSNKDIKIKVDEKEENLADILDLNIFKSLNTIVELKENNKNNYLEKDDRFYVLGKEKNAISLNNLYTRICNRKNGFNKFINSLLVIDGEENQELKRLMNKEIENLENKIIKVCDLNVFKSKLNGKKTSMSEFQSTGIKMKLSEEDKKSNDSISKIIKDKKSKKDLIGDFYYNDINYSKEYKDRYNKHKNLVAKQTYYIENNTNKNELSKINKELHDLKTEMDKITKENSKIRLNLKLRIAFGFIFSGEYKDFDDFMRNFDPNKKDIIDNYREKIEKYYNSKIDKDSKEFDIGELNKKLEFKKELFSPESENNLFKLYILFYLLIPVELRGDFLGFVKKHYYDIKNVDFFADTLEVDEDELDKHDSFFHNLRLFEKNSKKFEILSYTASDIIPIPADRKNDIYKKFGINVNVIYNRTSSNGSDKDSKNPVTEDMFYKNLLIPVFKYYQNAFKLCNDIEIVLLLKLLKDNNLNNISDAMNMCKAGQNLKFSKLLENSLGIKSNFSILRNNLSHLDYGGYFWNVLNVNDVTPSSIIESGFDEKISEINKNYLGIDFINDYFMRKERFIFNLKQFEAKEISSTEKVKRNNKNNDIMKNYGLNKDNVEDILGKYYEIENFVNKIEHENSNINIPDSLKPIISLKIIIEKKEKNLKDFINKQNYRDRCIEAIKKEMSLLLGIYKKEKILSLKVKLTNFFTKKERKILRVYVISKEKDDKNKDFFTPVIFERNIVDCSEKAFHEKDFKLVYEFENEEESKDKMKEYGLDFSINENCLECKINNEKMKIVSKEKREIKEAENKDKNSEKKECENRKEIRNIAGKYIFNYRIFSN